MIMHRSGPSWSLDAERLPGTNVVRVEFSAADIDGLSVSGFAHLHEPDPLAFFDLANQHGINWDYLFGKFGRYFSSCAFMPDTPLRLEARLNGTDDHIVIARLPESSWLEEEGCVLGDVYIGGKHTRVGLHARAVNPWSLERVLRDGSLDEMPVCWKFDGCRWVRIRRC